MSDASDKPHTVFVSHAHADNELCDRYVDALRKRGLDVWYDRSNLQVGDSLTEIIEAQLRSRTALVVLYTSSSIASRWVRREFAAYQRLVDGDHSRLLLPVRATTCEIPLLLTDYYWIDAVNLGFDATIDKLAVVLRAPTLLREQYQPGKVLPAEQGLRAADTTSPIPIIEEQARSAAWINRGQDLLNVRNPMAALTVFERTLEFDPTNSSAWVCKGDALSLLDRYSEALTAYERALEYDPKNSKAWGNKGRVLEWMRRYNEAMAAFDQAIELDPNDSTTRTHKSLTLLNHGKFDEAISASEQAMAVDPTSSGWAIKAFALRRLGREEEELQFLLEHGRELMDEREYEVALGVYERALELGQSDTAAWRGKGEALYKLERHNEALTAFDQALALDPNDAQAMCGKGWVLYGLNRFADALGLFERAVELDPHSHSAWTGKNDAQDALENTTKLATCERELAIDPTNPQLWHDKASALHGLYRQEEALNAYGQAVAAYERALDLDPTNAEMWHGKGEALRMTGRGEEALKAYERAVDLDPSRASTWYSMGDVLERIGRFDEAEAAWYRAERLTEDT